MSALEILARYVPPKLIAWASIAVMVAFVSLVGTLILAVAVGFEFKLAGMVFGRDPDWKDRTTSALPPGVIVASTKPCGDLAGGWEPYAEAEGRFVLGVGKGPLESAVFATQQGGEEFHALSVDEMPPHSHTITHGGTNMAISGVSIGTTFGVRDTNSSEETGLVGLGFAHNNMPPFIALYFCKKEG